MAHARFRSILAILVVAAGAGLYWYAGHADRATLPTLSRLPADEVPSRPRGAVAVEAAPVDVTTVVEELRAVGTLAPDEAVTVAPEIAGRIERISFREGQHVSAGDVLVQLDTTILRAELARFRSDLTLARANHERISTLSREGMAARQTRDEAWAALESAQAGLALAEARLAKTTIRAPLTGVVGLRSVSVGAYVTAGHAIVELADIDPIKLDFRVPELALSELRAGQSIRVRVDARPDKTYEGAIYAIDPVVETPGRAIRLRARIPNPRGELVPGLFARVDIVVARRENAIVVPESAVFSRDRMRYVYRVVEGRAVLTEVELGQRRPGQVEIRSGLASRDVVVRAGQQQLHDGARVELVGSRAAPREPASGL